MHAPYAAQYRVMGGSGAGSGGSFTLDAAAVVSAVPSALAADAAVAAVVVALSGAALAALGAEAPVAVAVAVVAAGALAPGAVAAAGMLAPIGVAEKVLGGKGGRDGAPVDEVGVAGLRDGICGSRAMSTLVCLVAAAKQLAVSTLRW